MTINGAHGEGDAENAAVGPTIIVLVTDEGGTDHCEVKTARDAEQAARLIETLIEAGYARERIRAFVGLESEIAIAYRPVVTLLDDGVVQLSRDRGRLSDHLPSDADQKARST